MVYILGGLTAWEDCAASGSLPKGHEFPKPLNRTQEGAIFKYFSAYTGSDNSYPYAKVRADGLEKYRLVCCFHSNIILMSDAVNL
jgi:hypothetical protein